MVVGDDGQLPLPWLDRPLREAMAHSRGHALLLEAAPGEGALEFAQVLAQAWLCEAPNAESAAGPCGRCASCRLVQARTHPDLDVRVPEALAETLGWPFQLDGGRKPSRQIRIDDVRSAIDRLSTSSARGRAKVLVLHPAEAMNTAAASALLKTLEEPAPDVRILLSTPDAGRLMPTVHSRCQRLAWTAPDRNQALRWLAGQGVEGAEVLLDAAGGLPLQAWAWAREGLLAAQWAAMPAAVAAAEDGPWSGWAVPRLVDALQRLCHDAMVCSAGSSPRFFPAQAVPRLPLAPLAHWARELQRVARHADHPWNEPLMRDALLAQAREALSASGRGRAPRKSDLEHRGSPDHDDHGRPPLATLAP